VSRSVASPSSRRVAWGAADIALVLTARRMSRTTLAPTHDSCATQLTGARARRGCVSFAPPASQCGPARACSQEPAPRARAAGEPRPRLRSRSAPVGSSEVTRYAPSKRTAGSGDDTQIVNCPLHWPILSLQRSFRRSSDGLPTLGPWGGAQRRGAAAAATVHPLISRF
jgi:hypothetical protein